ncbi:MAG: TilS substrate-binding domain-containing protein, partial [Stackebrandtia sp.]
RAACDELGLPVWHDPHNADPAFARARVRAAMPVLTDALGDDLPDNLARTAALVADDNRALDSWAASVAAEAVDGDEVNVAALQDVPRAVRTRVLRAWALARGVPGDNLFYVHIDAMDALTVRWRGQGPVHLPSGARASRRAGRLRIEAPEG